MNESEDAPATLTCPQCEAVNRSGTRFCTDCGAALGAEGGADPAAEPGRRRARRGDGDAAERSRARNEFGRIKNIVTTVRSVYWASTVFAAVQVLLWHVVLVRTQARDEAWVVPLVTALVWGQVGLTAAGALLVLRAPLLWTTVGACFWTLNSAFGLWAGDFTLDLTTLIQLFLLIAFWFAVAQAARVQKLMAADASLQLVRRRIDPARRVVGGVADEARAARAADRARTRAARWKLLGVVAVGLALVITAVRVLTAPPAVDDTVAAFAERWGRGDVDGLADLGAGGRTGREAAELREDLERRGWSAPLPALGAVAVEEHDEHAAANWPCGAGEVRAAFVRAGSAWRLTAVSLPALAPGDLAPAIAGFRDAWVAAGTGPLVALLRPASRERLGGTLQRMLEKRGWHERRPALGDVDPGRPGGGRARVLFALGDGELTVVFEWWHPQWRVVGVTLPQR